MTRISNSLALLLAASVLSACGGYSKDNFTVGSVDSNYKTRHPIVIDEKEQTLDIPVGSDTVRLPRAQESATEGFASKYRRSPSGTMTIMIPRHSPNASAARSMSHQVAEILRREGVPPSSIVTTSYDASRHGSAAPIRVSYHAVQASVERCGKWPEDLAGPNLDNQNWHNFGCANQNNMAAQIANPSDLVAPRGMTQADAERRNNVIEDYREGTTDLPPAANSVFAN
ncbi:CpaD family pilus assembly protein [Ahrensia sp. R2A130]|uniref:CpaD family pilus assembly protein n=1 Tax=Ahrensia sp. R2A130 TaxID=744979 RepID=UPI0001E0E876|nr:CpaD family pilus assembly protein [Ahrensia sp. R2A130]EFL89846.1 pilus assembly protein [Ahrensia sp. R2A130]